MQTAESRTSAGRSKDQQTSNWSAVAKTSKTLAVNRKNHLLRKQQEYSSKECSSQHFHGKLIQG
jgi:hypothetical protein